MTMEITIKKLHYSDANELLAFEIDNRAYFEEMVPGRGNDFYEVENFKSGLQSLLDEQEKGLSAFYLIKNESGIILGRINLVDINKEENLGHIGYRVGKVHTGKGIAHRALQLLTEEIRSRGFNELFAKTTTNNVASQKVLLKNGFKEESTGNEEFEMNGERVKFVYFRWINFE